MASHHAIQFKQKGDFSKFDGFCQQMLEAIKLGDLDLYAKRGVQALAAATPKDTYETATSWSYEIQRTKKSIKIIFNNSKVTREGTPIAILLQYGHATGNGGYVEGVDYINPALRPIFQQIADDAWREVTK